MKNLKLFSHERKSIPNDVPITHFCQSLENPNELILCHGVKISKFDFTTKKLTTIFNIVDEVPTVQEKDIVDVIYLSIQRTICLFLRLGEIFMINIDTLHVSIPDSNFYQQEIKAVKLSPDQELIVLVTSNLELYLLDYFLGVIVNGKLYDEAFGEREFITVGWGKKETQFHGSEGKEAAKSKPQYDIDVQHKNENYKITWRGDGMFFAVGFVLNSQSLFKVFNREGVLQYTSEKQPGLECNYSWRPSGNLIATTQILPNKYIISFFEKNGLKHGDFQLPFKNVEIDIKNIAWSEDSEVLSVWLDHKAKKQTYVLLYTVNNYHWYLKQSHIFSNDSNVSIVKWDENSVDNGGKLLHVIYENGIYEKFKWIWDVDQSLGKDLYDEATVGVIDGNNVLLTNFRKFVVPPPMAANTIEINNNVNHIIFCSNPTKYDSKINSNSFFVLTESGSIVMYAKDKNNYLFIGTGDFCIDKLNVITNLLWFSDKQIFCIVSNGNSSDILIVDVIFEDSNKLITKINKKVDLKKQIIGMKYLSDEEVMLQDSLGGLYTFSYLNGIKEYPQSFPECCYKFDVIKIDNEILPLGLTNRNRFYIEDYKIANNINSYYIHSDFLLLTTLQHQLLTCLLKKTNIKDLQNNTGDKDMQQQSQNDDLFANRRIERGAQLITAVSFDSRTILQMPRGNIEVIQPRTLSLNIIGKYLDQFEYKPAFDLMRKQRINLNLIFDHNPDGFNEHIKEFIVQINNPQWISLFISELEDQNVTKTMYNSTYKGSSIKMIEDKVKIVCEKMRQSLEELNEGNKNLLPIITTYVKSGKMSDLELALIKIKSVKDSEVNSGVKNVVSADDALKYLLLLVNVDELYNIALGLYDFNLVMFVAVKSQKDPKEYVPYLNKLKNMDENYSKFSIDNDLKRYESALKHLIKCEDRGEELISFVKQHTLYNIALRFLSANDVRYKDVCENYGNYLSARHHFKEAGIMFKRSINLEKALENFVEALEWQSALFIAHELKYTQEQLDEMEKSILYKLKEAGLYAEALCLLQYSNNYEEKVTCAIEGRLFKQSLNICLQHQQLNLIDEIIKPAVIEQYTSILNLLHSNESQFNSQKSRLAIVRENKLLNVKKMGEDEHLIADCDLYSDTSSIMGSTTSKSSGRSYRSSKNRRKHERKMVSLKEGSRYEDIALVRALHILVTATFNLRQDVSELIYVLKWLGYDEEAMMLQNLLQNLINNMTSSFLEIWPADFATINKPLDNTNAFDNTDSANSLEPYMRIPPVIQDIKWKLDL